MKKSRIKNTTIVVLDYPQTFTFQVPGHLPSWEGDHCEVRQKLLISEMEEQGVDSPLHEYSDYVIEDVTEISGGVTETEINTPNEIMVEIWVLGS